MNTSTVPVSKPPQLSPSLIVDSWHLHWQQPIVILIAILALIGFTVWLWLQLRSEQGTVGAGGLSYVVGPMGSGKSLFGIRTILGALRRGRYVVSNCRLLPGWEKDAAAKLFPRDRGEKRAARESWLIAHYIYEPSLVKAMRYRVPCAYCGGDVREVPDGVTSTGETPATCNHVGPDNEGRAVFVWDETHNDLNNRDYQGPGRERERETVCAPG